MLINRHPEKMFTQMYLTYDTTEVAAFLEQFNQASAKPVFAQARELLGAVKRFRELTAKDGLLGEIRQATITQENLVIAFNNLSDILQKNSLAQHSELSEEDQTVLSQALEYCKNSVRYRLQELQDEPIALAALEESHLRAALI